MGVRRQTGCRKHCWQTPSGGGHSPNGASRAPIPRNLSPARLCHLSLSNPSLFYVEPPNAQKLTGGWLRAQPFGAAQGCATLLPKFP